MKQLHFFCSKIEIFFVSTFNLNFYSRNWKNNFLKISISFLIVGNTHKGQERASVPQEVEWTAMWVLAIQPKPFIREANALTFKTLFFVQEFYQYVNFNLHINFLAYNKPFLWTWAFHFIVSTELSWIEKINLKIHILLT